MPEWNQKSGCPPSTIHGEMLQTLSRVYWMTGDNKYLNWAIQIADLYLLQTDFSETNYLKLRDHGCEIIGGLSELFLSLHHLLLPFNVF